MDVQPEDAAVGSGREAAQVAEVRVEGDQNGGYRGSPAQNFKIGAMPEAGILDVDHAPAGPVVQPAAEGSRNVLVEQQGCSVAIRHPASTITGARGATNRTAMTRRRWIYGATAVAAGQSAPPGTGAARVNPRLYSFCGGSAGMWRVESFRAVRGEGLPEVERIEVTQAARPGAVWILRGVTSNERYATREEKSELASRQAALGRPEAARAALLPIRKSAAWWGLTQDERRKIFEETSHHTAIGLKYLPAIARRLHHCRDLESSEPFDFLTWFDFAPEQAQAFEDLVGALRATEEWQYVDRELDIRLALDRV